MQPTIGRRVWVWQSVARGGLTVHDPLQAFDAGIVFVHPDGKVTLSVTDHDGDTMTIFWVSLGPSNPADRHIDEGEVPRYRATWMPYQEAQANAASPTPSQVTSPPPAVATPFKK